MSRQPSNSRAAAQQRPFYQMPEDKPTPVQIVNESRQWLRTVPTKRPFTPREEQRTLFGVRPAESRPPSAFSLGGARHFDPASDIASSAGSRPPSGSVRLIPLDHQRAYSAGREEAANRMPKPPSGERPSNLRRKNSTQRLHDDSTSWGHQSSQASSDLGSQPSTPTHSDVAGFGDSTLELAARRMSPKKRSPQRCPPGRPKPDSGYGSESRGNSAGSRGSSAGAGGPEAPDSDQAANEAAFFSRHIMPLLEVLTGSSGASTGGLPPANAEALIKAAEQLYDVLEEGSLLGRRCRRRVDILTTVCQLLDRSQPKLQLALGRIIFALKVTGNNLLNVSKLVFKVSKDKSNDELFQFYCLPPYLLRTAETTQSGFETPVIYETLVYCVGSIKFLTDNAELAEQFVNGDAVSILTGLADRMLANNEASNRINERLSHVLIQVVGALRHCADVKGTHERFLNSHTLPMLGTVLEQYPGDAELLFACSKLLSKLSMQPACCEALAEQSSFCQRCLQLLNRHHTKEDFVLRMSYVLGNLVARFEAARCSLIPDKPALDAALAVLKHYMEKDKGGDNGRNDKVEDIIVKMLRFLANASISDVVGTIIAQSNTMLKILLKIIKYRDATKHEELVMNAVYAFNNLTFYIDSETSMDAVDKQMAIAESLLAVVYIDNLDLLRECVRVYGNLSRSRVIRDFLITHQIDRLLVTLLDSRHPETVYAALGVLLNLMVDPEKRPKLKLDNGLQKLFDVLKEVGWQDWQVAGLVCKTLWNYTEHMTSSEAELGVKLSDSFIDLLNGYCDQNYVRDLYPESEDEELTNLCMELWRSEFLDVGRDLLERLEKHQNPLEPL